MFFKMLKKDLKQKKGLNVILFIFMVVASTLVVASAIQIYTQLAGKERTYEVCNSSDLVMISQFHVRNREKSQKAVMDWLSDRSEVTRITTGEMIGFASTRVDFDDFEEDLQPSFCEFMHFLTRQPFEQNLTYDLNDNPFYVENGCIAISQTIGDMTGVAIGDKVRFTTQMGYTYEFTVSHFFKDPMPITFQRYIVSDADYEILAEQSPFKTDVYELDLTDETVPILFLSDYIKAKVAGLDTLAMREDNTDDNYIIMYVVSVFMVLLSIFMILIIFMTVRFTMISAIKEEEKEIGMMKAIGVDSIGFRWMFAAKYIAFAFVGGIIGIFLGIPIAKIMLNMFCKNVIFPAISIMVMISILAVAAIIGTIILFIMLVMRRIKEISVMDIIYGENRGERFGKMSRLYLHKRRKMSIPLYLAMSDIVNRLKRYLFLIIAYTLGITVILCTVHLKNSIISQEFLKYMLITKYDFDISLSDEQWNSYMSKTGSDIGVLDYINQELENNHIPAKIYYDCLMSGNTTLKDGEEHQINMIYGEVDTEEFTYRQGSVAPKLANELAISYFTAKEQGLEIGDRLTITYFDLAEDKINHKKVTGEFVITGFFDYMESGTANVILGNEFENNYVDMACIVKTEIDAPKSQKEQYIEQMKALYGEESVRNAEEYLDYSMSDYVTLLNLVKYVLSGIILLVLISITSLYSSVLFEEEIPTIAMLKSLGFENSRIKIWQLLRMGILLVISMILGNILVNTVGQLLIIQLFRILGLTGFSFIIKPIETYILVPLLVCMVVLLTLLLRLKSVKQVEIWKIREE